MSEGEFKKRLLPFAMQLDGEFTISSDPSTLFEDDLNKILNEASKEFPLDSDEKYKGKLFTERNILLSGDRLQWFRKWFNPSASVCVEESKKEPEK